MKVVGKAAILIANPLLPSFNTQWRKSAARMGELKIHPGALLSLSFAGIIHQDSGGRPPARIIK
jgi:hypothetical protein